MLGIHIQVRYCHKKETSTGTKELLLCDKRWQEKEGL